MGKGANLCSTVLEKAREDDIQSPGRGINYTKKSGSWGAKVGKSVGSVEQGKVIFCMVPFIFLNDVRIEVMC